jgi:hypothetical protein
VGALKRAAAHGPSSLLCRGYQQGADQRAERISVDTLERLGELRTCTDLSAARASAREISDQPRSARGPSARRSRHEILAPSGRGTLGAGRAHLFLDLEGDKLAPDGGREYLFGYVTERAYVPLWAATPAEEKREFERVIDTILAEFRVDPAMHVYHFGHYEPAALKRLMGRYATRADAIDRLLRGERFVDLHAIVRHALRAASKLLDQNTSDSRANSRADTAATLSRRAISGRCTSSCRSKAHARATARGARAATARARARHRARRGAAANAAMVRRAGRTSRRRAARRQ